MHSLSAKQEDASEIDAVLEVSVLLLIFIYQSDVFYAAMPAATRSGEQRAAAQALVDRKGSFSVKYTPFNFQCKYPVKLRDSSLKTAYL
jgi:hypothetical protein